MTNDVTMPGGEPITIGKEDAPKMLGIGRTLWNKLVASGKTPQPKRLGRRVFWLRHELVAWAEAGFPNREKWEALNHVGKS